MLKSVINGDKEAKGLRPLTPAGGSAPKPPKRPILEIYIPKSHHRSFKIYAAPFLLDALALCSKSNSKPR